MKAHANNEPFVPAEAGIQRFALGSWVPAFAGMNGLMFSA